MIKKKLALINTPLDLQQVKQAANWMQQTYQIVVTQGKVHVFINIINISNSSHLHLEEDKFFLDSQQLQYVSINMENTKSYLLNLHAMISFTIVNSQQCHLFPFRGPHSGWPCVSCILSEKIVKHASANLNSQTVPHPFLPIFALTQSATLIYGRARCH